MTKKEEAQAKREAKLEAEKIRIQEMKTFELAVAEQHSVPQFPILIAGIDEAGRGPFAGPVVAGAVILDWQNPEREILYLNDSKKLSEKKRELLYWQILEHAIAVGVGYAGAQTIDRINILQATYVAMRNAIANLTNVSHLVAECSGNDANAEEAGDKDNKGTKFSKEHTAEDTHILVQRLVQYELPDAGKHPDADGTQQCQEGDRNNRRSYETIHPDYILADAVHIPEIMIPQQGIIKGDAKSVSIAAGSIIAKVTRDHIMYEYDRQYPEYGFASHKGYGTAAHIAAIREYGMTPIHRRSFIHLK